MSAAMKQSLFIEILMLSIILTLMISKTMANPNVETQENFLAKADSKKILTILRKDKQLFELLLTLSNDKEKNPEKYNEFYKRLQSSYNKIFGNDMQYNLCKFKICNMGSKSKSLAV